MTQAGSYAAGIFGRNDKPVPFQRINETSFSDGSLGAVQLSPRQAGAYRSGSLGAVEQPGVYRSGVLGQTPAQAQQAAILASQAAWIQARKASLRKTPRYKPTAGLGMFETLPTWALYAGGAAVLGAGYYFLFSKKKR